MECLSHEVHLNEAHSTNSQPASNKADVVTNFFLVTKTGKLAH